MHKKLDKKGIEQKRKEWRKKTELKKKRDE